jgi:hypothetical protein
MKKGFKQWLDLAIVIVDNISNVPALPCPKCKKESIAFQYVGDPQTRVGYLDIWCNSCLHGIHISRVLVPQKASMLPFETQIDEISKYIPNFTQVTP